MTTPSTDLWSELPIDIKAEIFFRLPERDLPMSKFVCKDWNFVISKVCIPTLSPSGPSAPLIGFLFFEDHSDAAGAGDSKFWKPVFLPRGQFGQSVLCRRNAQGRPIDGNILSLSPKSPEKANVLDCCNGVLLLAAPSLHYCSYYLGNPVTRERLAIPLNPKHKQNNSKVHSSLIFDPFISFNFKIVRFTRPAVDASPAQPIELDIFSWRTKTWSSHFLQLEEPHNLFGFEWIRRSVYFNGALYYISKAQYLVSIDDDILKLDGPDVDGCSALRAWSIELPDKFDHTTMENQDDDGHCGCIGNSSGKFYYSNRDAQGVFMFVWMLVVDRKNSHWVLQHRISIKHDIGGSFLAKLIEKAKRLDSFRPRAFHPLKDQIFFASPRVLIGYDLNTKEVCTSTSYVAFHGRSNIVFDHNLIFPLFRCMLLIGEFGSQ